MTRRRPAPEVAQTEALARYDRLRAEPPRSPRDHRTPLPSDLELLLGSILNHEGDSGPDVIRNMVGMTQNESTHDGSASRYPIVWEACRDLSRLLDQAENLFEFIRQWCDDHGYDAKTGRRFTR